VGGIRYAVSSGALTANPIRDTEPIEGGSLRPSRALTAEERRAWLAQLELDPKAVQDDLPDLTRFMLATGVRIGKALALYWEDVHLPAESTVGTVRIDSTLVRIKGEGWCGRIRRRLPPSARCLSRRERDAPGATTHRLR
jgi:integrase